MLLTFYAANLTKIECGLEREKRLVVDQKKKKGGGLRIQNVLNIHSFNNYLLSTYCVPGSLLVTRSIAIKKTD